MCILVSENGRYIIYISTYHVNFLSYDNDDMKPSKRQVSLKSICLNLFLYSI